MLKISNMSMNHITMYNTVCILDIMCGCKISASTMLKAIYNSKLCFQHHAQIDPGTCCSTCGCVHALE